MPKRGEGRFEQRDVGFAGADQDADFVPRPAGAMVLENAPGDFGGFLLGGGGTDEHAARLGAHGRETADGEARAAQGDQTAARRAGPGGQADGDCAALGLGADEVELGGGEAREAVPEKRPQRGRAPSCSAWAARCRY